MKQTKEQEKTFNLELTNGEHLTLETVLGDYLLAQADLIARDGYHPDSAIGKAIRMYNRLRNVRLGQHQNWTVDRLPPFLTAPAIRRTK